jgi:hypothetical protein
MVHWDEPLITREMTNFLMYLSLYVHACLYINTILGSSLYYSFVHLSPLLDFYIEEFPLSVAVISSRYSDNLLRTFDLAELTLDSEADKIGEIR